MKKIIIIIKEYECLAACDLIFCKRVITLSFKMKNWNEYSYFKNNKIL